MTSRCWARVARRGAVAAALAVAGACENPVQVETDHLEVAEVVVRDARGVELARTVENSRWTGGPVVVRRGASADLRVAFVGLDGRELTLAGRPDHRLRVEWRPDGVAGWEPLDGVERFHGLVVGETEARLMVWHVSHPDFIAPWLPVRVEP